ncbi:MAG: O-methyltransferase [Crocinitomicaceae bacterium]|nr:O-methyltransferase [Crocinitomicaceae bacterium]MDG1776837.1 O-methyltransferase [Crocinitomicaceae bacterium]
MEFISQKLDDYVCAHSEDEPVLLYDLNRDTHLNVLRPRMLSGHFQGRVLSMLSHMIQPKNVLEIGTYTGYSALCFAEGLADGGKITTIDKNEELEDLVNEYVAKSEFKDQIKCVIGDAMDLIPSMKEVFDLVFIDADKSNYINYYNMAMTKLSPGGYIIIDNVLWSGKVLEDVEPNDEDTQVLVDLNRIVHEDSRVQEVLFPIRDGLLVIRKK